MQDIGVGAARVVAVTKSEKTPRIFLELRGIRDAPHASDKDTRLRIALSNDQAGKLRRELSQVLPSRLEWQDQFLDILEEHRGETFLGEDAVEMLKRISAFWREHHPKPTG